MFDWYVRPNHWSAGVRAADAMLNSGTLVQSSVEKEYILCVHSQHCGKVGTN